MNTLISVRTNLFYCKKEKKLKEDADEYIKHHELIFLVDNAKYTQTNSGEIVRERAIDEVRFTVSTKAYDELINVLVRLKDIDETELS
jgi:hypothetical protein